MIDHRENRGPKGRPDTQRRYKTETEWKVARASRREGVIGLILVLSLDFLL